MLSLKGSIIGGSELHSRLVALALLHLLGRVPALRLHLAVNLLLALQSGVERGGEGLMNVRARGLDGAVHQQIARSLFEHEHIFHIISVCHGNLLLLQQAVEDAEHLAVLLLHLTGKALQLAVLQPLREIAAFVLKVLLVLSGSFFIPQGMMALSSMPIPGRRGMGALTALIIL